MSTVETYPRLVFAMDELRRTWRQRHLLEAALLIITAVLGVLVLAVAADNLLGLGVGGRVVALLLLLGIVTLVSSGLEQNHEDINRQLRVLGEQLLRFEQGHAGATPVAPHGRSGQNASTPHDAQPATTSTTKP